LSHAAAIAAIVNAHTLAAVGTRRALVDDHGVLRLARYVPADAEWTVDAGGCAYRTSSGPHVVHEIGVFGGDPTLIDWADERSRSALSPAPEGARVVLQAAVLEADDSTRRLLAAAGFEAVRTWSHLEIELRMSPPAPLWPHGISVRPFDQQREWPAVGAAMDEAFVDHWGHVATNNDDEREDEDEDEDQDEDVYDPYSNSEGFCFVAWAGDEVAGVLLGNERTVEWPDSGKVGSVTVRRPFRRKGLASALLRHAFGAFHRSGIRRAITDTDAESFTAGPVLYERVGMREYRRELVFERELRSGHELRSLGS
jgi:GNAT superfamily N-acetyltransferase